VSVVTSETAVEVPSGWVRRIAGPVRYGLGLLGSVSLTFLGLTCITFIIGWVTPIDPVTAIVGEKATRSTHERVFKELSLDRPIYEQAWILSTPSSAGSKAPAASMSPSRTSSSRRFTVAGRRFGGYRALVTAKAAVHRGNSGNDQFGEAIVRKLITEISALPPRRLAGTE